MRWSIVHLIWMRELRDQLRDRRTVFMVAVLPVVLYPLLGLGLAAVASPLGQTPQTVGVYGDGNLAPQADPPLFVEVSDGGWQISPAYDPDKTSLLKVRALPADDGPLSDPPTADQLAALRRPLERRVVDVVMIVPPGFARRLRDGGRPALVLLHRENDDFSRAADARLSADLTRWRNALRAERVKQLGLPADIDNPFTLDDPDLARHDGRGAATDLFGMLLRVFPFVLVMWAMVGALYPAVDLCAGEKERGTMETLLISPASREEIVWGKFLTVWVFSMATAVLNLLSMGLTTWRLSAGLPNDAFHPEVLLWGILLAPPLAALFSAVCLAVGAYARSSKEGQYYLMPLFLATLPLVFMTLLPGVELNGFTCLIPVTGAALLLQRLAAPTPGLSPWPYFLPVLAATALYGWLALRWAVAQFQREEVLFREAERLEVGLWLRRLFGRKV